jgi:peptide/nickel transport system substrate-binding protein
MSPSALRPARLMVLALVVALACESVPATARPSPTPSQEPRRGGRLVEGSFMDVKTLNPMLANDVASATVTGRIYDGLIYADPRSGDPKPNLATWTVAADGLTYSWQLQPGAAWSDGRPIVGADYLEVVRASARSKKTLRKTNFQMIEGFEEYAAGRSRTITGIRLSGSDPKAFTVRFTKVWCAAVTTAFGIAPIPAHVFGKYTVDEDAGRNLDEAPENLAPPVASGPFKLKDWRKGDQLVLDRNDTYFKGAPFVDQYVFKIVADVTALSSQLRSGEINFGAIEPKDYADISRRQELQILRFQQLGYTGIGWNTRSQTAPALQDKRVRQALAYGLDIDGFVKTALFGQGVKMVQHHPQIYWAAAPTASVESYRYEPAKAEELIRSAGYQRGADGYYAREGKPLSVTIVTNQGNKVRETLLQSASDQYKQIGVRVNARLEPFDATVDKLSTGAADVEAWIIGWSLGIDPDPYSIWHSSQIPDAAKRTTGFNFSRFTTPGLDKAINDGRTPADKDCGMAARQRSYEAFNKILNDEQPYEFGFSQFTLLTVPARLRGPQPGPFAVYWNIEKWWFAP